MVDKQLILFLSLCLRTHKPQNFCANTEFVIYKCEHLEKKRTTYQICKLERIIKDPVRSASEKHQMSSDC